ncbi:MAG: M20/M25/M40 family metallo-hydrolase [Caldilineaceae bacterium]
MQRNRPLYGFMALIIVLAFVGWRNANPTAQAANLLQSTTSAPRFGPVLFLIRANPLALPVTLPPTVVFHAQIAGGESPQYVASGGMNDFVSLKANGVEVILLDEDTTGDVYYFADGQAPNAKASIQTLGKLLLEQEQQLLFSVTVGQEVKVWETLAANGIWISALTADPLVLATEPNVEAASPRFIDELPSQTVTDLINQLSANEIYNYTAAQAGNTPVTINGQQVTIKSRYTFASDMHYAEQYLFDFFSQLGLNTSYFNWTYGAYSGKNVIAELPGVVSPSRIWLIGGHFDTISQNPYYDSPGADDNGTGVAATMAIARILSQYRFADTIRFVAFSGEEEGQWGSKVYAHDLRLRGEDIVGYINLDMIGWDSNSDNVMEIHTGYGPKSNALGAQFVATNERYGQGLTVEVKSSTASRFSDHSPFWDNDYGAFLVIENYFYDAPRAADKHPWNHTTGDILSRVPFDYVLRIGRTAMAMLIESAALQEGTPTVTPTTDPNVTPSPTSTQTPTPSVTPTLVPGSCSNLLTNGDLEGTNGWSFGTTPYAAGIVPSPVHNGQWALRMGLPAEVSNRTAHSSAYQLVAIPADAAQVMLRYWEKTGGSQDGADYHEALLLDSGYNVLHLIDRSFAAGNDSWTERNFDLTAYRGQTVVVYLNVYNDGTGTQQWNYVDDIALLSCSAGTPEPTATLTPTATETPTTITTPTATGEPTVTETPTVTVTPGGTIPPDGSEKVFLPVVSR